MFGYIVISSSVKSMLIVIVLLDFYLTQNSSSITIYKREKYLYVMQHN